MKPPLTWLFWLLAGFSGNASIYRLLSEDYGTAAMMFALAAMMISNAISTERAAKRDAEHEAYMEKKRAELKRLDDQLLELRVCQFDGTHGVSIPTPPPMRTEDAP